MPTLDDLEFRLQTLLEVHLLKYMPGYKTEDRIFQQLAAAMHNNLKEQNGITFAPDMYVIIAHPSTITRWHTAPQLLRQLAEALRTAGEEAGFHFFAYTTVTTAIDKDIAAEEVHIIASFNSESVAETRGNPSDTIAEIPADTIPPNAFLILGGTKIIPLNRPVINIGRRLENQIVIDDPCVSRAHAQLRIVKDCFVLFDLNSTGGTFVNGQRINKTILTPGDVISLAGVSLIFSQDLPTGGGPERVSTEPVSYNSSDRSTAVMDQTDKKNKKKVK
jgi:pSer/pThr/pTyr-binding forkhead associated (FHA) protein